MSKQIDALKLALEALKSSNKLINGTGTKLGLAGAMDGYYSGCFDVEGNNKLLTDAITAIKEALAQPEQDKERCVGCEACIDTACGRDECPKGWPKAAQLEQEPVAHCEAGPQYCQQCHMEDRSLALAAAVGYVQRNTPSLVSTEICKALSHIVDVNKMVEALREIGDFAHDKSTGPTVPDALWEIRSIAYNAIVEFELMKNTTPPQRTWVGLTDGEVEAIFQLKKGAYPTIREVEAKLKEKNT